MEQRGKYDIGGLGRESRQGLAAGADRSPDLVLSVVDHGISTMEVPMIPQLKGLEASKDTARISGKHTP